MTKTAVFAPEAVADPLVAAEFAQWVGGEVAGFYIADARDSRGEILVEVRRARYGQPDCDPTITGYEQRKLTELLEAYLGAIVAAGYRAEIDMRMVVVTDLPC